MLDKLSIASLPSPITASIASPCCISTQAGFAKFEALEDEFGQQSL